MIEHALFPTFVAEFMYPDHDKFKPIFYQHIFKYMTPEGYSNEFTNHVNIHHEENFAPYFMFAIKCVEQYLDRLHIDKDLFDINVTKTWMNIRKEGSTGRHSHGDAHISFTYYPNVPKNFDRPIRFYNYEHRHEPYPGACRWNNTSGIWDHLNSGTWEFKPKEGNIFVFPSNLVHDTLGTPENYQDEGTPTPEKLDQQRVCMAADVILTYKDRTGSPLGIQPVENWRRFSNV